MILLDGIEYSNNTPEENANELIAVTNQYCSDNNIQNSKGEVIQVDASWANPLYVMYRAIGYLASRLQSLLYSAGCALSIPSSSERQLLNIADVAGIKRRDKTKTTIVGTVYANRATDTDPTVCRITTTLSLTAATTQGSVVFHPAFDVSIPVDSSATIILIAEAYGSYSISSNDDATFDENPVGFRKMVLQESSPGQDQETISSLRQRLQRRQDEGTQQDKAITAIESLPGVSLCNIYFNQSVTDTETVMGIEVLPRHAVVFVQGWSNDIAKAFYENMSCQCNGENSSQAIVQTYTAKNGQQFKLPVLIPENQPVYIRVYINQLVDDSVKQEMRDTIATLATTRTIGQRLTSAEVLELLQHTFDSYEFGGCTVSLDNQAYTYQVQPKTYQLLVFDDSKLQIIGTE